MTEHKDSKPKDDGGAAEVQAATDKELEQGFRGVEVDTTPNEHYTVAGVTAGKPTPETDQKQADKVRDDARAAQRTTDR